MALCLFEDETVARLAPLTRTRAAFDLRVGARLLGEAQRAAFPDAGPLVLWTRPEVAGVTAEAHPDARVNAPLDGEGALFVNARWLVRDGDLLDAIRAAARPGEPARAWTQGDSVVAAWHPNPPAGPRDVAGLAETTEAVHDAILMDRLWHLLDDLEERLTHDIDLLGGQGTHDGARVQAGALLVHPERIHLGPGTTVRPGAILNAESGPIHVGAGAAVEEGAVLRGPVYVGPKAVVHPAGRVEASALGYWSKVGGEVQGSILHSLSNKAHDGYLGNSYLGRWCNLGADTNTSNLKNDYGEVTLWDAVAGDFVATGRRFLGLVMGDHAKCSINTMFNTGTVVGVFCNLFGSGFPPRYVPDFSWGGAEGLTAYRLEKALRVAEAVQARRNQPLTDAERALLGRIAGEAHGG